MKRNKIKSRLLSLILTGILISSTAITSFATVPENQVPPMQDYPTGQFLVPGDIGGYFLWTVPKSGVYRLVMQGGASSLSTRLDADPVNIVKDVSSSIRNDYKVVYKSGKNVIQIDWYKVAPRLFFKKDPRIVRPLKGHAEVTLTRGQKLHIFVGGNGQFNETNGVATGGFNGGGDGNVPVNVTTNKDWAAYKANSGSLNVQGKIPSDINYIQAGSGGGATDIRMNANPDDSTEYLKHILLSSPGIYKEFSVYSTHVPAKATELTGQPYVLPSWWGSTNTETPKYQMSPYGPFLYNDLNEASGKESLTGTLGRVSYYFNSDQTTYRFKYNFNGTTHTVNKNIPMQQGTLPDSTNSAQYSITSVNSVETYLADITPAKYSGIRSTILQNSTPPGMNLDLDGDGNWMGNVGEKYHKWRLYNTWGLEEYYTKSTIYKVRFGGVGNFMPYPNSNAGLNRLSGDKPFSASTDWPIHPDRPGISWKFMQADPSIPDIPIDIPNLVPPQIEVATAPSTAPTKNNLSITLRGSDDATPPSTLEFLTVPGLAAPTITSTSTYKQAVYTFTENGTYTFRVKDAEGNVGTYTYTVSNIDKTPPSVSYKLSTNNPTNGNVFIELDARDNIEVKEIRDASNTKIGDTGASIEVSANGNYSFKAIDTALNERTVTVSVTNIDKTAPTAPKMTKVGTDQFTMSAVGDNMTPIDKIKLQYSINGGDWLTYLGTPIDIPEGNYNIRGKAIDNAGNETITTSTGNLEGSYSTEHPTINIIMQQTNPTQEKSKVELRVQTNDTVGIKSINISSPSGSSVLPSVTIPNSETKKITDFRFNLMADKNGIYKVTVEKWGDGVNPGLKSNLDVEVKNIDTANPSVNINESNLQRISSTTTRLSISGSDIYDDLSPTSKMKVSVQGTSKWYSLSSTGVTLTHGASDTTLNLIVQDESGRQTVKALDIPSLPTYGGGTGGTGEAGDHVGTPSDALTPKPVNQLEQEIQIPSIGTHYQLSHDNVNWGTWEERGSVPNIKVTLPTGDGVKNVYVRTGFAEDKTQAIFNSVTGEVEYVPNGESAVKPLDNTIKTAFVFDLTPPSLILTSRNNTWVADEEGNLNVEVELIDNLDTKPGVKLTLTNYKDELIWESANDLFMPENSTTIRLPVKNLFKDPLDTRQKGFNLRVEGKDKNGNKVVKNQVIYGKFLKP